MSAKRLQAKYPGSCHACAGGIVAGEEIVWLPPKGHRKRGQAIHDRCAKAHGETRYRGTPGAWRKNREWTTAEEFAMVEDAMSRMRPPS